MVRIILLSLMIFSATNALAECSADITFGATPTDITGPTVSGMRHPTEFNQAVSKYYMSMYGANDKYFATTITNKICDDYFTCQNVNNVDLLTPTSSASAIFVDNSKYSRQFWISNAATQTKITDFYSSGATNTTDALILNQRYLMTEGSTSLIGDPKVGLQIAIEMPKPYVQTTSGMAGALNINSKTGGIYYRVKNRTKYIDSWSPWIRMDKKEIESKYLKTRNIDVRYLVVDEHFIKAEGAPIEVNRAMLMLNQGLAFLNDSQKIKALVARLVITPNSYVDFTTKAIRGINEITVGTDSTNQLVAGRLGDDIFGTRLRFSVNNKFVHFNDNEIIMLTGVNTLSTGVPLNTIKINKNKFDTLQGDLILDSSTKSISMLGTIELEMLEIADSLVVNKIYAEQGTMTMKLSDGSEFNFNDKNLTNASTVIVGSLIIDGATTLITTSESGLFLSGRSFDFNDKEVYAATALVGNLLINKSTMRSQNSEDLTVAAASGFNFNNFPLHIQADNNSSGLSISSAGNVQTKIVKRGFLFSSGDSTAKLLLSAGSGFDFSNKKFTIDSSSLIKTNVGEYTIDSSGIISLNNGSDTKMFDLQATGAIKVQTTDGSSALVNGILANSGLVSVRYMKDFFASFPINNFALPTEQLDMSGQRIINLGNPSASDDLVNLNYFNQAIQSPIKNYFQCHITTTGAVEYKLPTITGMECPFSTTAISISVNNDGNVGSAHGGQDAKANSKITINMPTGKYFIVYSDIVSCGVRQRNGAMRAFTELWPQNEFSVDGNLKLSLYGRMASYGTGYYHPGNVGLRRGSDGGERSGTITILNRQSFITDVTDSVLISHSIGGNAINNYDDWSGAGYGACNEYLQAPYGDDSGANSGREDIGLMITGFCFANCAEN